MVHPVLWYVHGGLLLEKLLLIVLLSERVLLLILLLLVVVRQALVVLKLLFVEAKTRGGRLFGTRFVLLLLLLLLVLRILRLDPRVGYLRDDGSHGLTRLCWQRFAVVVLGLRVVFFVGIEYRVGIEREKKKDAKWKKGWSVQHWFVGCGVWRGIGVRKEGMTDNNSVQDSDNCPPVFMRL